MTPFDLLCVAVIMCFAHSMWTAHDIKGLRARVRKLEIINNESTLHNRVRDLEARHR